MRYLALGLAVTVTILVAHDIYADSEGPPDEYVRVYAPEYSMDMPESWVIQPPTRFNDVINMFFLGAFTNVQSDDIWHVLVNGRTDQIVDVSAVERYSDLPPTIYVTVGPSNVSSYTFLQQYKHFAVNVNQIDESNSWLTYESVTDAGGTVNGWYTRTGLPDNSSWHRTASYTLVANGTAYIIEYVADVDTYDENYRHFERVVSSLVPLDTRLYDTGNSTVPEDATSESSTVPEDPRCMGTASCIVGKVTRVIDGDTLIVDDVRVRLALVDTHEVEHSSGDVIRSIVAAVCQTGSDATIDEDDGQTEGSYGRMLGVVWCGSINLNEFLVDIGYGNIITRYCQVSEFNGEMWAGPCRR